MRGGSARKGYLSQAKLYQSVRISPVEVYERIGKSVISVFKKAQNFGVITLTHFIAMKKSRKRSGFVIYFYIKDSPFKAVKWDAIF